MAANRRLLELALKGLEAERRRIDQEIDEIQQQLQGTSESPKILGRVTRMPPPRRYRRVFSAAQRKAASARMKKYWAERRREAA